MDSSSLPNNSGAYRAIPVTSRDQASSYEELMVKKSTRRTYAVVFATSAVTALIFTCLSQTRDHSERRMMFQRVMPFGHAARSSQLFSVGAQPLGQGPLNMHEINAEGNQLETPMLRSSRFGQSLENVPKLGMQVARAWKSVPDVFFSGAGVSNWYKKTASVSDNTLGSNIYLRAFCPEGKSIIACESDVILNNYGEVCGNFIGTYVMLKGIGGFSRDGCYLQYEAVRQCDHTSVEVALNCK